MALIKCTECEANISDRATACPKCGYPLAPIVKTYNSPLISRMEELEKLHAKVSRPQVSNGTAAVLSFFIPGAGQMYKGHIVSGLAWLFFTVIGYAMMIFPGLIIHVFCIFMAYDSSPAETSYSSSNDGC